MTPDGVIALRRKWQHYPHIGTGELPAATVLATSDWLAYVSAMASMIELDPNGRVVTDTIEECGWAWPDGVLIVFDHAFEIEHTITSHQDHKTGKTIEHHDRPYFEDQTVEAIVIQPPAVIEEDDVALHGHYSAYEWLGPDLGDVTNGWYAFGIGRGAASPRLGHSTQMLLAMVVALGHRLTTLTEVTGSRAMQRRVGREIPGGLRVLELTNSASKAESQGGHIEWRKRWLVRGHWRNQACGPGMTLRKRRWIDPYVKGPEDMPLDVRTTIWETTPVE